MDTRNTGSTISNVEPLRSFRGFAEGLLEAIPRFQKPLATGEHFVPVETERPLVGPSPLMKPLRPIYYSMDNQLNDPFSSVSIIIPSFDEEITIGECIRKCVSVMEASGIDYEVIVVDDGSTDDTYIEAKRAAKEEEDRVCILRHPRNLGKGRAIRTGALHASKDILVIQDADLEYSPSEIPHLVSPITDLGYGIVYGSRFLGSTNGMKSTHRMGNRILTATTNMLYGTAFSDVMTGHKVFHRDAFQQIGVSADRFIFEVEFTSKSVLERLNVAEIPVDYHVRRFGKAKIRWIDGITCLAWILGFRFLHFLRRAFS